MHRLADFPQLFYAWMASRSFTAKFSMGVVLTVGLVAIVSLIQTSTPANLIPVLVQHKLEPREISAMQLAFAEEGLNGYEIDGSTVRVPESERGLYLKAIAKHNVVDTAGQGTVSQSFNPFLTSRQRADLRIEQKKQRLRSNLLRMKLIDDVWIEYCETTVDGPFRETLRTAVINVRMKQQSHLDQNAVGIICRATRGTFPGLADEQIEIIDLENDVAYGGRLSRSPAQAARLQVLEQKSLLKKRIDDCLSGFPSFRISISVDETLPPMPGNDRPGNFIVASTRTDQLAGDERERHSLVGTNGRAIIRNAGFQPDNNLSDAPAALPSYELPAVVVNVSIGIPEDFVRTALLRKTPNRNKPLEWDEIQNGFLSLRNQIEQTIRSQLPDRQTGSISVILESANENTATTEAQSMAARARLWFEDNWKTVVLVVFGMCALLILRPAKSKRNQTR